VRARASSAGALVAALIVAAALPAGAPAAKAPFAPLDQPGPKLRVDREKLRGSLTCSGGVRDAQRAPVLLLSATGVNSRDNFSWNYQRLLDQRGIPWCASDQFGPRNANQTDIQLRGQYITNAIRRMHRIAGRRIAIMGHSQGGMAMRVALRFWPDTRRMVDDVIGLAPPNHGTTQSRFSCGDGVCTPAEWQQWDRSEFIRALNSRRQTFRGISYTQVFTNLDQVVVPPRRASSLSGPGAITNVAIQEVCPNATAEHLGVGTTDPIAAALVLDALEHPGPADPGRIPPATCAQLFQPGINPATIGSDLAAAAAALARGQGTPARRREPQLRCWVFKSKRHCRLWRQGR
jgi:hypothetical protein